MANRFLDDLIKKYGEDITIREYTEGIPVVSTGSLSLDVSTGVGGIPYGRITEIYGPDGSGKTTMCLYVAKEALDQGKRVLYVDMENSLDYGYTSDIVGEYDEDQFVVVQPKEGEQALIIAETGIEAGFGVVIFDSIAAINPKKELEDKFMKSHVGLTPRLASKFLRRQGGNIATKEVAMIFTNQVRANIGSYIGDLTTPAGFALKHHTSLRIYLAYGGKIKEKEEVIGHWIRFIIKKNKVARPYRTATIPYIYGYGIDYYRDVISFGNLLGIVYTRGSYYAFEDDTIGLGMARSADELRDNKELLDKIVETCYNTVGVPLPKVVKEEIDGENAKD